MNYITKEKRDEVLNETFTFPNGIVQAYQEYRNVNELLYQGHNVDPEVRNMAREQMFLLDRAHCFELSKDIFRFALKSEMTDWGWVQITATSGVFCQHGKYLCNKVETGCPNGAVIAFRLGNSGSLTTYPAKFCRLKSETRTHVYCCLSITFFV